MLLLLRNVIASNSTIIWAVYGVFIFIFLFTASYIVVKRLIPAIKGDIALTLDEQGINDYIRDVSIEWKDIEEIKLIRGRSASIIRIDLKWESDYGKQLLIPLRWIKGRDAEIYDTVMAYFVADEQE